MDASEKRKEKLKQFFQSLKAVGQFSKGQARERCGHLTPHFVAVTLKDLVREGILDRYQQGDVETFVWKDKEIREDPMPWIDRRVRGTQVTSQPEQERPRERLLAKGAEALSDAELLAILIRVGVKGESAIEAGRRLSTSFGGRLGCIRRTAKEQLRKISPAVTAASYASLMAGIELGRRVARQERFSRTAQTAITSTREAIDYCDAVFGGLAISADQEEFHIVTLDTKHFPINTHRVTVGTLDASLVHPREVFRPAIRDAASAVILAHNHPSGDPTPSHEDHLVTERLTEAGKLIGITVLDHIVVASGGSVSIREMA